MRNDPIDMQDEELDSFRQGQLKQRGQSQKILNASGKVKVSRRDDEANLLNNNDEQSMEFDKDYDIDEASSPGNMIR